MTKDEKIQAVCQAIENHFIETGEDVSVKEIAEIMGWSESRVRSVIEDVWRHDIIARKDSRTSYSKNYRGFDAGAHVVWVYGPSRSRMRKMIQAMR